MFEGRSQEVVRDISNVKQEIISYRKIIKPERSTLRMLERRVETFLPEDLEDYFDDIVDSAERIWDLLDNYKEVVDGLESTNESVLAHRQNDVLRLLTVISVTILPLTLVTGLFGMNVLFPGEGTREAFWVDRGRAARRLGGDARLLPLARLALGALLRKPAVAIRRLTPRLEARVCLSPVGRVALGRRAVSRRRLVEREADAVGSTRSDGEDDARATARADDRVLRPRRTVDEVPRCK